MRKKGIFLVLALAGLFTACNDAIDITQPGEISNPHEVFRNAADVKRGISGIYISLPGESEIEFNSVFTDEVSIGRDNGGQGLISGEYGFFLQPGTAFATSTWSSYYSVINRVNRLISIADELIVSNPSEATILKSHKAELLGLRAYANLKLFAYFTPDYTNPAGFSIMKADFVPSESGLNEYIGRSTVSEITQFIVDDIDQAISLRTEAWVIGGYNYLTADILRGFKVKLYSMTGNYSAIPVLMNEIMSNPNYKFANAQQYVDLFIKNPAVPTSEIMWKLARPLGSGGNVAEAWYSSSVSATGSYFYEMGRSLYNELDKLDSTVEGQDYAAVRNDVRYDVNLATGTEVATNYQSLPQASYVTNDILLIGKFKGKDGPFPAALKNDIPVLRYADLVLLLAEARAAAGQYDLTSTDPDALIGDYSTVANIIYNVRFQRAKNFTLITMPTINNAQSAWKAILDERRVEFAFEGHRYLDMKRLGVKAGSPGYVRYEKDGVVNGAYNLPATDHRITLPIPNSELNANPTIRNQQNPGYSN